MDMDEALDPKAQPKTEYGRRALASLLGRPYEPAPLSGEAAERRIAQLEEENRVLNNWTGIFLRLMKSYWEAMQEEKGVEEACIALFEHYQSAQRYGTIHRIMEGADAKALEPVGSTRFASLEIHDR